MSDSDDRRGGGYGKPPKAFQFKKGQSGNPRGRPPRLKTDAEILARINSEPIQISINGKKRWVKPVEAAARKTLQMCLSHGRVRDLDYLLKLFKQEGYDWRAAMKAEAEAGADDAMRMIKRAIDNMFPIGAEQGDEMMRTVETNSQAPTICPRCGDPLKQFPLSEA